MWIETVQTRNNKVQSRRKSRRLRPVRGRRLLPGIIVSGDPGKFNRKAFDGVGPGSGRAAWSADKNETDAHVSESSGALSLAKVRPRDAMATGETEV